MRCPKHPDVWLHENMVETHGLCPRCDKSYLLEKEHSCAKCGQKPAVLCGLHPLNPAKILEYRCREHWPFKHPYPEKNDKNF